MGVSGWVSGWGARAFRRSVRGSRGEVSIGSRRGWAAPTSVNAPKSVARYNAVGLGMSTSLTVAGFQKLIRERYYASDSARGPAGTFLLFMEEVGELATALHDNRPGKSPTPEQRANLSEEFADVIAWLSTLANITGVDLETALKKYTEGGVEGVKD